MFDYLQYNIIVRRAVACCRRKTRKKRADIESAPTNLLYYSSVGVDVLGDPFLCKSYFITDAGGPGGRPLQIMVDFISVVATTRVCG